MESQFKSFNDKVNKKDQDIQDYQDKIEEGNKTIESIKK